MKKKIFTLMTLALLSIGSVWATDFTIGLTQAKDDTGKTLGSATFTGYEEGEVAYVTNGGNLLGSEVDSYKASGASKTVYINNTAYTSDAQWRKTVNTSVYSANQWAGYELTVKSGYKLNITGVHAMLAIADNTTYKWKVSIQNSGGDILYESKDKTTTKTSTTDFTVTTSSLDTDVQTALTGITGTIRVRVYMYQSGTTKYFAIPALTITGNVEEDTRTNYTVDTSVAPASSGTISGGGDWVEGSNVTLTATPNEGYYFTSWVIDGVSGITTNPYVISGIDANHTVVANFATLYRASYSLGEYAGTITGKVLCSYNAANSINEIYADKDDNYTIPAYAHKYLYREGYTFAGWSYGGNTYSSGDVISGLTENITITPTWTATTQTLANSSASTEVTWSFAKADLVFMDWQSSDKYGYYTQTATVNGETIAIPMKITKGKVGNYTRTDDLAQTNQETQITIPAVKGMTVAISDAYTNLSTTTIAGSTDYTGTGTKSISYTYTGEASTIDIVINEKNQYLKTIAVTYPAMTIAKEITSAEYATFVPSDKVSVPAGVKAYIVTATDATTATLSADDAITVIPANTPVVIKGDEGTYYFPKTTADPSDVAGNKLNTGAVTADGTQYILANGTSGVGFYKATPETEIAAGVAYLVSPSGSAPYFIFGIEGGTTGIDSVQGSEFTVNGEYYNLAGQRVAQPTKGLYIVNGKKVVVK